ncbi:MAG: hypothetical protein ACRD0C_17080 [Acidimicrobiia bacterium]
MNISETLLAYSVEEFLTDAETASVLEMLDRHTAPLPVRAMTPGHNGRSIHSLDGFSVEETVEIYEPRGRLELDAVADDVSEVMDRAVHRRWDDLRRALPSARRVDPWIYLEYGPEQYVTPHIDYAWNEDFPDHPKVAGISVQLNDGFLGGELFVETSASPRLWRAADGREVVAAGADLSSHWFPSTPRTRWTSTPRRGTAYLYGSQLVHGTLPVLRGRVRKLISFVTA